MKSASLIKIFPALSADLPGFGLILPRLSASAEKKGAFPLIADHAASRERALQA